MMRNHRSLRIAVVSTLWEQVPPKMYGGIELVVGLHVDGLVARGHDVTLFASGDAHTEAKLDPACDFAIRHDPLSKQTSMGRLYRKNKTMEILQLQKVYSRAHEFDIIHSHLEVSALPFASQVDTPTIHTLHMDLTQEAGTVYSKYPNQGLVSISDAQREPFPNLNYISTVYNAIDVEQHLFAIHPQSPPYMAFLGRLSPEKGILNAIEVSRRTGLPLKIAGKIGKEDESFYKENVEHLIDGDQICYVGEVNHQEKVKLLSNAAVTLFPVNWREPFGLVMIESMACGTPVIGLNNGSVPEVIKHGETGFVCQNLAEVIDSVPAAIALNRKHCRRHVEQKFGVKQMIDGYEAAYNQVLMNRQLAA